MEYSKEEIKRAAHDYFRLQVCNARYCVHNPADNEGHAKYDPSRYTGKTPICCIGECFRADDVVSFLEIK